MSNFSLGQLTEGIRSRHLGSQNRQLVEKWSRTGLLRGLDGVHRENMSRLLENQAAQVLREQSSVSAGAGGLASSGDLRGFSNIAFPIVRRVFGGLVANDLVSIQPMSLPSGLLFYLDYTRPGLTDVSGLGAPQISSGSSVYNDPTGRGVRSGSLGTGGLYDLAGNAYSRVFDDANNVTFTISGSYKGEGGSWSDAPNHSNKKPAGAATKRNVSISGSDGKAIQFDPQLSSAVTDKSHAFRLAFIAVDSKFANADTSLVKEWAVTGGDVGNIDSSIQTGASKNVRRLNQLVTLTSAGNGT